MKTGVHKSDRFNLVFCHMWVSTPSFQCIGVAQSQFQTVISDEPTSGHGQIC